MRVLHCIPSFGGGGAERQLAYLASELVRLGVDVHVAYVQGGPNHERFIRSGATLHELPSKSSFSPANVFHLVRLIRRLRPDIVQTWLRQMDVLAGMAARICGVPFLISERSSAAGYGRGIRDQFRQFVALGAAGVVANSESGAQYWTQRNRVPAFVVRNALPMVESVTPITRTEPDTPLIVAAGRFHWEKNFHFLLEVLRAALIEQPNATGVLLGDGYMRDHAVQVAADPMLGGRLQILSYAPDLTEWLRRASLYVSLSSFEGCPNTVLEAAACRCPMLLSDIPPHRELFDDTSAWFASATDVAAASRAIVAALQDPARSRDKAEGAFQVVRGFTSRSMADGYLGVYRRVLEGGNSGSTARKTALGARAGVE